MKYKFLPTDKKQIVNRTKEIERHIKLNQNMDYWIPEWEKNFQQLLSDKDLVDYLNTDLDKSNFQWDYNDLTKEQKDYVDTLQYYQQKKYKKDYVATMKEIEEKDIELFNYITYGK